MEFDDLMKILGQFGKHQKLNYFALSLQNFLTAYVTLSMTFLADVPDHWCRVPELDHYNLTVEKVRDLSVPPLSPDNPSALSSCSRYAYNYSRLDLSPGSERPSDDNLTASEACPHGWVYSRDVYLSTIVSEFDLVCDRAWLAGLSSSVYMAGFLVGSLITSGVSDIIGRKPTYIICLLGSSASGLAVSFSTSYSMFCVLRFFSAFFTIGMSTVACILSLEIVGPDVRTHIGAAVGYLWSIAFISVTPFAYFFKDWSTQNLVALAVFIPLCIPSLFVTESARWLYTKQHKAKADAIIRRAARMNRVKLPSQLDVNIKTAATGYIWDIWRNRRYGLISANLCFNWFVNSCVYYGLSLNSTRLAGDKVLNFFLSGLVEMPATVACHLAMYFVGRRLPLCVCMLLGGCSLLAIIAVPKDMAWLTVTLAMAGKFGITASFTIVSFVSIEVYPTLVRTAGVGCGSFAGRVGGVLAPFIQELSVVSEVLPVVIFGTMSIAAGLLALLLPETKGTYLPDTMMEDAHPLRVNSSKTKPKRPSLDCYIPMGKIRTTNSSIQSQPT